QIKYYQVCHFSFSDVELPRGWIQRHARDGSRQGRVTLGLDAIVEREMASPLIEPVNPSCTGVTDVDAGRRGGYAHHVRCVTRVQGVYHLQCCPIDSQKV